MVVVPLASSRARPTATVRAFTAARTATATSATPFDLPASRFSLGASLVDPNDRATATDRRAGDALNNRVCNRRRNLDDRVRFANVDFTDFTARDAGLVCDCADEISGPHIIACTDVDEQPNNWPDLSFARRCAARRGLRSRGARGPLALEELKGRGGDLDAVEPIEQRLERQQLASELA